jgi:MFS family permease
VDRNLKLLSAGFAIRTFGSALYNPFLALFLYSILHVGYLDIGIIFLALGALQLPFGILGGMWCDRVGRRRLIVLSLATEALGAAVLAYAFQIQSLWLGVATAGVAGCVLAATGPAFSAYIADWGTGSNRTMAFTWYRISFNAGFAAGVAVGGILVTLVGYPLAVATSAAIIAGAAIFTFVLLHPSPYDLDLGAAPESTPRSASSSAPAHTLRQSFALLLTDRPALLAACGLGFIWLTASQWGVTFPLFVHNKMGISYAILGLGLSLNGLIVVVGQFSTTRSVLGVRHTTLAILGGALYVVAFLVLGLSTLWMWFPVLVFFVAVVVLTMGENVGSIPASVLPSNLAPPGEVGAYNGAFGAIMGTGGIGAVFVGGAVLASIGNPLFEWVVMVLPAFAGFLLVRIAARKIPIAKDTA